MTQLFISDLHLSQGQPGLTGLFLDFLHSTTQGAERLYILGDLFDAWIGDDALDDCAQTVIQALISLGKSSCQIFIQGGNRDFLLGHHFAKACRASLLGDTEVIDLLGKRCLLMHGDLLCSDDRDYQNARVILRNPAFMADFLAKPIPERLALAKGYRQQSLDAISGKASEIMDVTELTVLEYLDRFQAELLIHGHTHRPGVSTLPPNGQRQRYCLGDWGPSGTRYLHASPEQGLRLLAFP
jgi:UDP-2,3-diacylglucosamine hydrolase